MTLRIEEKVVFLHLQKWEEKEHKDKKHKENEQAKMRKGTSINHLGEVRLFITRYKPKAQCRDIQTSENCVPKGRDIYTEYL